jgi:hypothetical protein
MFRFALSSYVASILKNFVANLMFLKFINFSESAWNIYFILFLLSWPTYDSEYHRYAKSTEISKIIVLGFNPRHTSGCFEFSEQNLGVSYMSSYYEILVTWEMRGVRTDARCLLRMLLIFKVVTRANIYDFFWNPLTIYNFYASTHLILELISAIL